MFAKYVGLTAAAALAIESKRKSPAESESDIIERELGSREPVSQGDKADAVSVLDVGQGIALLVGETIHLFLSKSDALAGKPVGSALVTSKGLLVEGKLFGKDRGSYVQKPMQMFQERHSHRGADGKLVPLSAYRQWYAHRNGTLVSLEELKDPGKTRRRRTSVQMSEDLSHLSSTELLERLGL